MRFTLGAVVTPAVLLQHVHVRGWLLLRSAACACDPAARPARRAQVLSEPMASTELSRLQRLSIRGAWHSALAPDQLKAWARAAASSMTLLCLSDGAGNADEWTSGEQNCASGSTCTRGVLSLDRLRYEAELHADESCDAMRAASVLEPFAHLRRLQCLCLDGAINKSPLQVALPVSQICVTTCMISG